MLFQKNAEKLGLDSERPPSNHSHKLREFPEIPDT